MFLFPICIATMAVMSLAVVPDTRREKETLRLKLRQTARDRHGDRDRDRHRDRDRDRDTYRPPDSWKDTNTEIRPADVRSDTEEWCRVIKSSPEPDIIFYNRIPKCASSTMLALYGARELKIRKTKAFESFNLHRKFWFDYPNPVLQEELYEEVNKHIQTPATKIVFNSHTGYFPFNQSAMKYQKLVEHTQVVRGCEARQMSASLYGLYGVMTRKKANRTKLYQHIQKHLSLTKESDVEPCLSSEACLKKKMLPANKSNLIATYMGGCEHNNCQSFSEKVQAVQTNIQAKGAYKTFGMSEFLSEYLEMLECVYPSMLTSISSIYENTDVLQMNKRDVINYHPPAVEIISKLSKAKCLDSPDTYLYHMLNATFWSRYQAMKTSPSSCCRPKSMLSIS